MADKVVLDFRSSDGPTATHVRSTLLGSSLETMRVLGFYERFASLLPSAYHEQILYTFAPMWLPVDVAVAYYDTWARLGLSEPELEHAAGMVCERIMGSFLATLARGARQSGATPWIPLRQYDRLWSRIFRGGAVRVTEKGPKDALIETHGLPMLRSPYFRLAYRSLLMTAGRLFARKLHMRERRVKASDAYAVLASWV